MDVYTQASHILARVLAKRGTAKQLCLEKDVQKKKQTYAVVCETEKNLQLLDAVIERSNLAEKVPSDTPANLIRVMLFDFLCGRGVATSKGIALILKQNTALLYRIADEWQRENQGWKQEQEQQQEENTSIIYARINYMLIPSDRTFTTPRGATVDEYLFDVVAFPPGSKLHAHPLVKRGTLVLQDRASCLPAHVLFNCLVDVRKELPPRVVVDACSSPGNKTTHIASLQRYYRVENPHVFAIERDTKRFETLQSRVARLSGEKRNQTTTIDPDSNAIDTPTQPQQSIISCHHVDFLEVGPTDFGDDNPVDAFIVDPSCSGGHADISGERVERLAELQHQLMHHSLTAFPSARCVVYSTCSRTTTENEEVVQKLLEEDNLKEQWELAEALSSWPTRGTESEFPTIGRMCLRNDNPAFFVACFVKKTECRDRVGVAHATSTKKIAANEEGAASKKKRERLE